MFKRLVYGEFIENLSVFVKSDNKLITINNCSHFLTILVNKHEVIIC